MLMTICNLKRRLLPSSNWNFSQSQSCRGFKTCGLWLTYTEKMLTVAMLRHCSDTSWLMMVYCEKKIDRSTSRHILLLSSHSSSYSLGRCSSGDMSPWLDGLLLGEQESLGEIVTLNELASFKLCSFMPSRLKQTFSKHMVLFLRLTYIEDYKELSSKLMLRCVFLRFLISNDLQSFLDVFT